MELEASRWLYQRHRLKLIFESVLIDEFHPWLFG